jgi:hypothetical protein
MESEFLIILKWILNLETSAKLLNNENFNKLKNDFENFNEKIYFIHLLSQIKT